MADVATLKARIADLEEMLALTAGTSQVSTDGNTTQFNPSAATRELKRLKRELAKAEGRRPGVANIDLSGG